MELLSREKSKKPLDRNRSGFMGECLVLAKLVSLGYTVKFADTTNQEGYDLIILDTVKKIEVKHIQTSESTSNDSFILKRSQAELDLFDNLVLIISNFTNDNGFNNLKYYIFSNHEIRSIFSNKGTSSGNFTFNLNKEGTKLASTDLSPFQDQWKKI
ncbi:hypothetical protein COM08_15510 [Bacillus wiedmannii]|uniref:hypothetical protein n=1 Tax=Bacillus TaxID=1386 RepID=UPI000BFA3F17|nr:hypothetical protein [Bacillus wiedmannii]PGC17904.1 hypothetical protein COM08_15510 [Bacillus wiedmannii]